MADNDNGLPPKVAQPDGAALYAGGVQLSVSGECVETVETCNNDNAEEYCDQVLEGVFEECCEVDFAHLECYFPPCVSGEWTRPHSIYCIYRDKES